MDLLQEYSELKKTIDYHMDRYYNQDEPEISDYEYDKLMIRLKEIEKEHPEWVTSDSPSQKIGGTVKREAGVKVTHNVPMLSIEDVFSEDAVCAWIDKVHAMHPDCTFSVETKIDGLSMSLRYVKEADGNTVVVIEHNLDVIKTEDYIIDMGPEGGDKGGTVIAKGTPEEVAESPVSYTGKYIKKMLDKKERTSTRARDTSQRIKEKGVSI